MKNNRKNRRLSYIREKNKIRINGFYKIGFKMALSNELKNNTKELSMLIKRMIDDSVNSFFKKYRLKNFKAKDCEIFKEKYDCGFLIDTLIVRINIVRSFNE